MKKLVGMMLCLSLIFSGLSVSGWSEEEEKFAATVNGEGIPQSDLNTLLKYALENREDEPTVDERFEMKLNILNGLVFAKMLFQKAMEADIPVPATEVERNLGQVRNNFETESEFLKSLAEQGHTLKQYKKTVENELRVRKYQEKIMDDFEIVVTEGDLKDWYEDNIDDYRTPEYARIAHILVALPEDSKKPQVDAAYQEISDIRRQVISGAQDFEMMARLYSDDIDSATRGGALGIFSKGIMRPRFEHFVFSSEEGEISEPILANDGWHIIKVLNRIPSRHLTFEEAKESGTLENDYVKNQKALYFRDWLARQREKTRVEIIDPEIVTLD